MHRGDVTPTGFVEIAPFVGTTIDEVHVGTELSTYGVSFAPVAGKTPYF